MLRTSLLCAGLAAALFHRGFGVRAHAAVSMDAITVPIVRGLTLTSADHSPDGDRENRVVIADVTAEGVTYHWTFDQYTADAKQHAHYDFQRFVSAADLSNAPRLNAVFRGQNDRVTPGYTAFTISRTTFKKLLADGHASYAVTNMEAPAGAIGTMLPTRLTYHGTLALASRTPDSMPVLLNGHRTKLPVVHVHGAYAMQEKSLAEDYWVLADTTHPLLLKSSISGDVWQMIRIDLPIAGTLAANEEGELQKNCRMELPGVYFAFNSAVLESASAPAIAGVVAMLHHHPDWSVTIEGHTDSIGNPQSNRALSQARAEAVRTALVQQRIDAGRLSATGFGATRPRESNTTIEGRARNRRVELVRSCAAKH